MRSKWTARFFEFGFPMGRSPVGDLSGFDIGWRNRKVRAHLPKPSIRDSILVDKVCEMGRLGQIQIESSNSVLPQRD
jgi:3-hydroxyacyl-CoA dehydrogenase